MLKILVKRKDAKDLVILGLEEGNIEKLKEEQPIAFKASEVGLCVAGFKDPRTIAICYDGPDWKANKNAIYSNPNIRFCFIFNDKQLEKLKLGQEIIIETPEYDFLFVYGKDGQTLCNRFKSGISSETIVKMKGFAPNDSPQLFLN